MQEYVLVKQQQGTEKSETQTNTTSKRNEKENCDWPSLRQYLV